jgi:hypothetical protein
LGILLAVKLIPPPIMADLRARASQQRRPVSKAGLLAIITIWLSVIALVVWAIWPNERQQ